MVKTATHTALVHPSTASVGNTLGSALSTISFCQITSHPSSCGFTIYHAPTLLPPAPKQEKRSEQDVRVRWRFGIIPSERTVPTREASVCVQARGAMCMPPLTRNTRWGIKITANKRKGGEQQLLQNKRKRQMHEILLYFPPTLHPLPPAAGRKIRQSFAVTRL